MTLSIGLLIYAGTGIAGLLMGGAYLDYFVLLHDPAHGQELGITMIEVGVGLCVASAMTTIFLVFAGRDCGEEDI